MTEATEQELLKQVKRIADALEARASAPQRSAPPAQRSVPQTQRPAQRGSGAVFPPYGRSKGAPIAGASEQDLLYYRSGCERTLADRSKSKWHAQERALIDAIDAEIDAQNGRGDMGPPPPGFEEGGGSGRPNGGPSDLDVPFARAETGVDRI